MKRHLTRCKGGKVVKKYQMDPNASWEERYKQLEAHHIEETEHLYKALKFQRAVLKQINESRCDDCREALEEAKQLLESDDPK